MHNTLTTGNSLPTQVPLPGSIRNDCRRSRPGERMGACMRCHMCDAGRRPCTDRPATAMLHSSTNAQQQRYVGEWQYYHGRYIYIVLVAWWHGGMVAGYQPMHMARDTIMHHAKPEQSMCVPCMTKPAAWKGTHRTGCV